MLNYAKDARKQAVDLARNLIEKKPVYLDTETTGLSQTDEIVEIGIVDHDGSILFDELVKPSKPIPFESSRIHGIKDEMVANSRSWPVLWPQVRSILTGRVIGIYNASFDVRMMKQSFELYRLPWREKLNAVDILDLYARYYGQWDNRRGNYRFQSLENAGKQCSISLPNSHRASDDALLTRALLHYMAENE